RAARPPRRRSIARGSGSAQAGSRSRPLSPCSRHSWSRLSSTRSSWGCFRRVRRHTCSACRPCSSRAGSSSARCAMLRRRAARSTRSTWRVPRRAVCSDTSPSGPWAIRRSMGWRAPSVSWRRRCSFARRHPASVSAGSPPSGPRSVWSPCSVCGVGCSPRRGSDVMTALRHGARSVTAVEVNRAVVALMRGRYAEYSGEVYADTRVHLVEDEARSFVRRSADRYDLVVMTVVDSFAALSSGAYALTESYLYTQEAMADYLAHLAPGGSLSVGRWYRDPPVEIVRTFKIAVAGLTALGKSNPETHIAVLRYGNFGLLLIGDRAY